MKLRRTLLALAAATTALAGATFALPAAAQNYKSEYRMSLVVGPAFPWGKGGEIWANKVREKTNGRINIKLYPGVSLIQGDQTREFSALRQGVIDMAVGSTINWSPQVKQLNLFSLPFLMPDYAAIDALTQGEVGKQMFSILDKAGALDREEWAQVRRHAEFTETILTRIDAFAELGRIAGAHHERLDGGGYPRGLAADRIALETRIITTADIFDAITADRPYRAAIPPQQALAMMEKTVGTALDPDCFAALKDAVARVEL